MDTDRPKPLAKIPQHSPDAFKARRVRELREAMGLSQEALASRVPGHIARLDVWAFEGGGGENSFRVWRGLARVLELRLDDFDAYLEGQIDLDDVRRRQGGRNAQPPPADNGSLGHAQSLDVLRAILPCLPEPTREAVGAILGRSVTPAPPKSAARPSVR